VWPTPDGFVALHDAPGTSYRMVERLQPFDFLWINTTCREQNCGESRQWWRVTGVPRLDGPRGSPNKKGHTSGWVMARYIKEIDCPI